MTVWRLAIFIKSAHLRFKIEDVRCTFNITHDVWIFISTRHMTFDTWHIEHCPITIIFFAGNFHGSVLIKFKMCTYQSQSIRESFVLQSCLFAWYNVFYSQLHSIRGWWVPNKKPPLEKWCKDIFIWVDPEFEFWARILKLFIISRHFSLRPTKLTQTFLLQAKARYRLLAILPQPPHNT